MICLAELASALDPLGNRMSYARPDAPRKRWAGFFLGVWPRRFAFSVVLAALLVSLAPPGSVGAEDGTRRFPIYSTILAEHWDLVRWDNSRIVCELFIKSEQNKHWPSLSDIENNCSKDVVQSWANTG
ncbi:MAG: hypothetical protein LUO89_07535, partial [Methanothrix sp.]|nr:hypothetical protein [Methanothrix sp.]